MYRECALCVLVLGAAMERPSAQDGAAATLAPAARASTTGACAVAELQSRAPRDTKITSATLVEASGSLSAHCLVDGRETGNGAVQFLLPKLDIEPPGFQVALPLAVLVVHLLLDCLAHYALLNRTRRPALPGVTGAATHSPVFKHS